MTKHAIHFIRLIKIIQIKTSQIFKNKGLEIFRMQ